MSKGKASTKKAKKGTQKSNSGASRKAHRASKAVNDKSVSSNTQPVEVENTQVMNDPKNGNPQSQPATQAPAEVKAEVKAPETAVQPTQPTAPAVPSEVTLPPATPSVPAPVVPAAPAVVPPSEALPEIEEPAYVEPTYPEYTGERKKIALLLSGGFNSTLMLLSLVQQGHEVCPYFLDDGSDKARRDLRKAKLIVRKIRKNKPFGKFVHKLEVIEGFKVKKGGLLRKELILNLTRNLKGSGMNAIALGLFPLDIEAEEEEESSDESDESESEESSMPSEEREDNMVELLQENTPIEVMGFESLGLTELGQALSNVAGSPVRGVLFFATSCLKSNKKKECGECENCIMRHRAFIKLWGEDKTRYMKGSKVWKRIRKALKKVEEAAVPHGAGAGTGTAVPAAPVVVPVPSPEAGDENDEEITLEQAQNAMRLLKKKFKKGKIDEKKFKKMRKELKAVIAKLEAMEAEESDEEESDESVAEESESDESSDEEEEELTGVLGHEESEEDSDED